MKDQSIESILAYDQLKKRLIKEGDICPYEMLSMALNKDPQTEGYPYVMTARKRFEREHNCTLDALKNVGIKWLLPDELANKGGSDFAHLRRVGRRIFREQSNLVGRLDLKPETLTKVTTTMCNVATVNHFMKPSARKKIAEAVQITGGRLLPVADTLALFQPKKDGSEKVQ